MSTPLANLIERRREAVNEFDRFATPIIQADRNLTPAEQARSAKLQANVAKLDAKIEKAKRSGVVSVRSEPRTYGTGSKNSYVADLARASSPQWPGHYAAQERLQRHAQEVAVEARSGKRAERERCTRALQDINRVEQRTGLDTGASSGGSFVTPVYDLADYAPYRQFGRQFVDASHKRPLPAYGMTVYIPHVTAAAGVASQAAQGDGVTEVDPTSGYLSANLTTLAGQVTVSQQLLDRAGPDFEFDMLVLDQLRRAHALEVDTTVINAALAAPGSVTRGSQVTIAELYSDVGNAKQSTVTAAGTVLPATHLWATPTMWEWAATRTDSNGRPLIIPNGAGVFQSFAAGGGKSMAEGDTGYNMLGLDVFTDGNIPLSSTDQQMIVADMDEIFVFEGEANTRTLPQPLASNLQVLIQLWSYVATIVRYPLAVVSITGAGYPGTPTF